MARHSFRFSSFIMLALSAPPRYGHSDEALNISFRFVNRRRSGAIARAAIPLCNDPADARDRELASTLDETSPGRAHRGAAGRAVRASTDNSRFDDTTAMGRPIEQVFAEVVDVDLHS